MGRPWTQTEDDLVELYYHRQTIQTIAQILAKHGFTRTADAIRCRANRHLGLNRQTVDGLSIADAARHLGVKEGRLWVWLKRRGIKTSGQGSMRIVSFKQLEELRVVFRPKPADSLTLAEACAILGYTAKPVQRFAQMGAITAVRIGGRNHYTKASVMALAEKMRRTGATCLDLSQWELGRQLQAKNREYAAKRRAKRRAERQMQEESA